MTDNDRLRGLYAKYRVERTDPDTQERHKACRVFVLEPEHDPHARAGLAAYANAVREEYPLLAADLDTWLKQYRKSPKVQGYCPMGCGQTLVLNVEAEAVTCSNVDCPSPVAIDVLLEDPETEHVIEVGAHDFSVQHPLRERLLGALFDCGLHRYLSELGGPPVEPGRYRAAWDPGEQDPGAVGWERLS